MPEFRGRRFTDERLRQLPRLDRIRSLSLYGTSVTDEGIRELDQAPKLEEIHIVSNVLTDACMPTLCSLPRLRSLLLDSVPGITDNGVAAIASASGLRELYLNGTQVTDHGLRHLTHLGDLRSLCLNDTSVSDEGVRLFGSLPSLTLLSLNRTRVAGEGLASLADHEHFSLYLAGSVVDDHGVRVAAGRLTNLMRLDLSGTQITDQSAPSLARLARLNDLRLQNTAITDTSLQLFHDHPSLEAIYLHGCRTSTQGIADLQHNARNLTIYADADS